MVYVNVYSVTREYGGPEEGGWWYNALNCEHSEWVPIEEAEQTKKDLREEFKGAERGDIYSARGGVEIVILIEEKQAQSETRERPAWS